MELLQDHKKLVKLVISGISAITELTVGYSAITTAKELKDNFAMACLDNGMWYRKDEVSSASTTGPGGHQAVFAHCARVVLENQGLWYSGITQAKASLALRSSDFDVMSCSSKAYWALCNAIALKDMIETASRIKAAKEKEEKAQAEADRAKLEADKALVHTDDSEVVETTYTEELVDSSSVESASADEVKKEVAVNSMGYLLYELKADMGEVSEKMSKKELLERVAFYQEVIEQMIAENN